MKNKVLIGIMIALIIGALGAFAYLELRFKLEVTLSDNLDVPFGMEVNLKEFILESNGLFNDLYVTYYELGERKVTLTYLDKYDKEREYSFNINVIDTENPIIMASESKTTYLGEEIDLLKNVICADYASSNVECIVEGTYNIDELGSYNLKYVATDEGNNKTYKDFILNVIERPKTTTPSTQVEPTYTYFTDVLSTYKNDNTLVGIDVSRFQGDIDFNKVKEAGADFVIIRLGWHVDDELGLDYNYEKYIEDAYNAGIRIGLYFYSEAKSMEDIDKTVDFIAHNIKYNIDLPIAYDWEDFYDYNTYNLSLYEFNNLAYHFMDKLNEIGYDSILYGSKVYLTNLWIPNDYPVWLAQYYKEVTYEGEYKIWQLTDNGKIDGISRTVDIDILYLN